MEVIDSIKEIATGPVMILLIPIATTLIEIAPIKINPWSRLFKWIGDIMNGEILKEIDHLKKDVATIKRDQEEDNAENMRCRILDFAGSCRRHEHHDTEEWNNIISVLRKYETYVKERHIDNGVIEENAVYLRELYHERLVNNDFT